MYTRHPTFVTATSGMLSVDTATGKTLEMSMNEAKNGMRVKKSADRGMVENEIASLNSQRNANRRLKMKLRV